MRLTVGGGIGSQWGPVPTQRRPDRHVRSALLLLRGWRPDIARTPSAALSKAAPIG